MDEQEARHCEACGRTKPASEFTGKSKRCDECVGAWYVFRQGIDAILDDDRPSRAGVEEHDWRERAYAWARNHMPNETTLVRHVAQREVDARERNATRRGNKYLRLWWKGQIPLFWHDVGHLPIALLDPNGGMLHVRLDVATVADGRTFAREERERAKQNYDERLALSQAVESLAEWAADAGLMTLAQLGDQPPHAQKAA